MQGTARNADPSAGKTTPCLDMWRSSKSGSGRRRLIPPARSCIGRLHPPEIRTTALFPRPRTKMLKQRQADEHQTEDQDRRPGDMLLHDQSPLIAGGDRPGNVANGKSTIVKRP